MEILFSFVNLNRIVNFEELKRPKVLYL